MRRLAAPVVMALLLAPLSGGCASTEQKYCATLSDDQTRLSEILGSEDPGGLLTGLPTLKALGAKAPDDLTDEWQTFLNALEGLQSALRAAGVKPATYKDGLPKSVTGSTRQAVVDAADNLADPDVLSAANGIETQARDVCKVDLGL